MKRLLRNDKSKAMEKLVIEAEEAATKGRQGYDLFIQDHSIDLRQVPGSNEWTNQR